jgi:site-specific DNA-methyltransferase (adenine-specific)
MTNRLYYGDNLEVLRAHIADASVDLIYLDPPFNSNAGYNVLFKSASGAGADASIEAFDDTWTWGPKSQEAMLDIAGGTNRPLQVMMSAMHSALGDSPLMAYLAMMAVRLVELHRVLRDTGSFYLHCDPTASHYLKLVLDAVFGTKQYINEIIWPRANAHNFKTRYWPRQHDTIFLYAKGKELTLNAQYQPYGEAQLKRYRQDADGRYYTGQDMTVSLVRRHRQFEWRGVKPPEHRSWGASKEQLEQWLAEGRILLREDGRPRMDGLKKYLDEMKGKQVGSVWTDIERVKNTAEERLGYPTQKPRALLERIIAASSKEGDVVLDPFCGCGTAVDAA